jgi:hypothetical protein
MPLKSLHCNNTKVADLAPLKGMPMQTLHCDGTQVADLAPLKGMPLHSLHCSGTKVSDFSPLKGMKLKSLVLDLPRYSPDPDRLAELKGLMGPQLLVNHMPLGLLIRYGERFRKLPPERHAGLRGELFRDKEFKQSVKSQIFPWLGWNWGPGRPDPDVGGDNFSIRWTGWLTAPAAGQYTLRVRVDDRAQVWVDGQPVLAVASSGHKSATLELTGKPQSLKVEFVEGGGNALCFLYWKPPGGVEELIPPEAFSHDP